jgi:hypothetical protein
VGGVERPKELARAEMMTLWVRRLAPGCGDEQLIAARAHHLRRWSIPRNDHPRDRAGCLRWRAALRRQGRGGHHAGGRLRRRAIAGVQAIVRKQGLGRDPEVHVHEDALCLMFLETQFDELTGQLDDEPKIIDILARRRSRTAIGTRASPAEDGAGGAARRPALPPA